MCCQYFNKYLPQKCSCVLYIASTWCTEKEGAWEQRKFGNFSSFSKKEKKNGDLWYRSFSIAKCREIVWHLGRVFCHHLQDQSPKSVTLGNMKPEEHRPMWLYN